jgi:hypothetical protein
MYLSEPNDGWLLMSHCSIKGLMTQKLRSSYVSVRSIAYLLTDTQRAVHPLHFLSSLLDCSIMSDGFHILLSLIASSKSPNQNVTVATRSAAAGGAAEAAQESPMGGASIGSTGTRARKKNRPSSFESLERVFLFFRF